MHGASSGGHGPQWSTDVLMEGLAAARGEDSRSGSSTAAHAETADSSSRKRQLEAAGVLHETSGKRHAAAASTATARKPATVDGPFELNVGGRVFTTRRSTLTMEDGSMLANLFNERSAFDEIDRDPAGRVFLDRDGDSFAVVLDYLRRAGRLVGKHSADMLSRVREDAEYFGLQGLVAAIDAYNEAAEAERAHVQESEDAKRLAEAVAAEERQAAREAALRRRKVVAYRHMLYGPLNTMPGTNFDTDEKRLEELHKSQAGLKRDCDQGWRVDKMSSDADGTYLDLLLSRETGQLVADH